VSSAPGAAVAFTTAVIEGICLSYAAIPAIPPLRPKVEAVCWNDRGGGPSTAKPEEVKVRAYVLINASAGKAIDVARSLQGVTGIQHADAITGEYDVIAQVEAPDVAGIGTIIVDKIQKVDGVFKTVTCLAVR
jgi:DNA-binding Lrp family transcriptional regulator